MLFAPLYMYITYFLPILSGLFYSLLLLLYFEINKNHEGILYVHCNSSDYKHICQGIVDIQQQNNITIYLHVLIEYPEVEVYTDRELLSKILTI